MAHDSVQERRSLNAWQTKRRRQRSSTMPGRRDAPADGSLAIHLTIYILSCMGEEWDIEIEPEVRHWLDNLSDRDYLQAEHAAERLLDAPTTQSA